MLTLEKFTFGVGDRFAHQAKAQLRAFEIAAARGVAIVPVWNKSNREHTTIGSQPPSVLAAAQNAVAELGWTGGFHVDADHIRLDTVAGFLDTSDFFTIDVADSIGQPASGDDVAAFVARHGELIGAISVPGIAEQLQISAEEVTRVANKYLLATREASEFGRTPTAEGNDGREHHPFGFTMFLAGGGIKGGMIHGTTDEFGWHATENKVHVHDLHATILHLMGIDHEKLTYQYGGRNYRLTDVSGNIIQPILA